MQALVPAVPVSDHVLALIPAYNESAQIGAVTEAARRFLPVLVVDDGSQDDTASLARAAGAEVLAQFPNQGKGAALLRGFQAALQRGVQAVITLDADGQHDPAEIPAFLNHFSHARADLIIGKRNFRQMPPVRRLSNTLGAALFSWAAGQPIADNQSGYRLISQRLLQVLLQEPGSERGFEFEVDMIVRCIQAGMRLDWIEIRTIYAGEKSHIRPLRHLAGFLQTCWRTHQTLRNTSRKA
ncbi:MAG: glycosyltransferase family 2 protein [Chloroflexota bacterium]